MNERGFDDLLRHMAVSSIDLLRHMPLSAIGVGVVAADPDGGVSWMNELAERMTGWPLSEARGRSVDGVFRLVAEDERPLRTTAVAAGGGPRREDALLVRRDAERFPIELAVSPLLAADGSSRGLTIVFADASERFLARAHLARVAEQDLLTGLLNRKAFTEHVDRALVEARESGMHHVVCFLDIDQFKLVNTTCGHEAGDDLLQWVAALLRESVGEHDAAARFGGDEFAILLADRDLAGAVTFVHELQERLRRFVFSWGDSSFVITASIGVAEVGGRFETSAQVLSAVDQACYMAKDAGRGAIQVFERGEDDVDRRLSEMNWAARVTRELQEGRAQLYAQPLRPLAGSGSGGLQLEVLLRLTSGPGRVLEPGRLIRAAERFGLMPSVDRWVIRQAVRSLGRLDRSDLRRVDLCFVNLSALSLRDDGVLDYVRDQLSEAGIPPHKLGFEITETAAVQDMDHARWFIQEVASLGCRLSLDDFGTGFASYGYLKELPVEYVKIAGGFVGGMMSSALDRAMVESINQISHVLGIRTVAESVESEELLGAVRALGIDYAQGYWIAMPRPIERVLTAA